VLAEPLQATLDACVRLRDVTFCVVDLETTGGSPSECAITEIGAVLHRGGERLRTFQTLVDPRQPIPPYVARLTGIDDRMVSTAPPIEQVLPAFVEFVRGTEFVAHNARFDFSFVNENLVRLDYPPLAGPPICTAKLARRVVWPDVPNVRLATLAQYFRTRATPVHRALADAEACAEVLDGLLELGGRLGIVTLGDVREACRARGRPHFGKIALADALPHAPGVYLFRGRDGRVLYVGKSKDLRSRVKSYFYGDERKNVQDLLAEAHAVDGVQTVGDLEALVLEARLIRQHEPSYNRRGKTWRRYAYLKLDLHEAFPRLKVVRSPPPADGCVFLGPFPNAGRARLAKEAIEEVIPVRRCSTAMTARTRFAPCALADIGRCPAPCDGRIDPERYGELVGDLRSSLSSPGELLAALENRMRSLAAAERFEEAADMRERLRALAEAIWRARVDRWLTAGRLVLNTDDGHPVELLHGTLRSPARPNAGPNAGPKAGSDAPDEAPFTLPCPRERADELTAVRSWVCRHAPKVHDCDVGPAEPVAGGAPLAAILRTLRAARASPAGRRGR
jgi:DNA polymerase-3 subunit epsilon